MKKYLQITVVLGLFFAFVIGKSLYKGDDENVSVGAPQAVNSNSTTTSQNSTSSNTATYKDGTYTGTSEDAIYGNIKVQAVVSGGKITDVIFLDHPSDNHDSEYINSQAMPLLKAEAISAQSANVDIVSGASDTSIAFRQSLASALSQAQN